MGQGLLYRVGFMPFLRLGLKADLARRIRSLGAHSLHFSGFRMSTRIGNRALCKELYVPSSSVMGKATFGTEPTNSLHESLTQKSSTPNPHTNSQARTTWDA